MSFWKMQTKTGYWRRWIAAFHFVGILLPNRNRLCWMLRILLACWKQRNVIRHNAMTLRQMSPFSGGNRTRHVCPTRIASCGYQTMNERLVGSCGPLVVLKTSNPLNIVCSLTMVGHRHETMMAGCLVVMTVAHCLDGTMVADSHDVNPTEMVVAVRLVASH